ncbi:MAG: PAS domain S-box protein [Gammaproteobacteria bacterium]|nr:PAS domain S-box protein [Gammaproteobacteria bacterium]
MNWNSTLLITLIDAVMVLGAATAVWVVLMHRSTMLRLNMAGSMHGLVAGLCVISALYAADLATVLVMPLFASQGATMAAVRELHLGWGRVAVLAGFSGAVAGLVYLVTKVLPRIVGMVADFEADGHAKPGEGLLADAIMGLPEGFALYDRHDRLLLCNEVYRDQAFLAGGAIPSGATFEEILRARLAHGDYPDAVGREEEWLAERLRIHRETPGPIEQQHSNGRWYQIHERRMREGCTALVSTEITEHKRAEGALRQSEARFRAVIDHSPAAIYLKDTDGRYLLVNRQFERWCGAQAREIIGKTVADLYPAAETALYVAQDRRTLESGETTTEEAQVPHPDGSVRTAIIIKFPVFDPDGNVVAIGGVNTDISERKRAEEALREARDTLERRVRERTAELRQANERLTREITERERTQEALRESRELYAALLQLAPVGLFVQWSADGTIVFVNDRAVELLGAKSRDELIGRSLIEYLHPDFRTQARARNGRVLAGNPVEPAVEGRIVRPDGTVIDVERSVVACQFRGQPALQSIIYDITERKRAEEALRESEARFKDFAEGTNDWVWEMDADLRYTYVSSSYEYYSGVAAQDIIGHTRPELYARALAEFDQNELDRWQEYNRLLESRQTFRNFEHKWIRPDGEARYFLASAKPVLDAQGRFAGYRGIGSDITDVKRQEERVREELERRVEERTAELRAAQADVLRQERLATLGQLTATVSHELRNPLGVVRTSAFVLQNRLRDADPVGVRALERIERSIVRCDRIIDELLDFTRIVDIELEPTPIDAWLEGVLAEQPLPAGVRLCKEFGLSETQVPFDQDRFERAVINVFENACQAMSGEDQETQGRERSLSVRTRRRNRRIEVIFEDEGPGIPSDVRQRIFEPLFSTKTFGVGLGLPVVKQIMEQHGGGVEIETETRRGTRVCLWLHATTRTEGVAA